MYKTFFEKYMSSAAFLRSPDEPAAKTAAELAAEARKNIVVTNSTTTREEENNENEENNEEEEEEEESEEEEEEEEEKEETDEQKQERLAREKEEKENAKEQRKTDRVQKRIDKAVAAQKEAEAEVERLKAQLKEQPKEGLTEEEVERRATEKAKKSIEEKETSENKVKFEKMCDTLHDGAIKLNKDFEKNVNEMANEIGGIPEPLIYILSDLDNKNGADVLEYLAQPDNIDEMEEIYKLPAHRATNKLVRLSDKLKEAAKKPIRKQSAVPPPIEPVGEGNVRQSNALPKNPTQNMDEFIRIRNKQEEEKRRLRGR